MKHYYQLIKPGISYMQIVTASIGYFYAQIWVNDSIQWFSWAYLNLILGTFLISAAAGTLNQISEKNIDAQMKRTQNRPLVTQKISSKNATLFAGLLLLSGGYLLYTINIGVILVAYLTVALYILAYTPLKRISWLNTYVGAVPGALPILGGWLAVTSRLEFPVIPLLLVLFAWQHPHFYALAVMYKDDYAKANLKMLPVLDPSFIRTSQQTLLFSILTVIGSLWLVLLNLSGILYAIIMSALGAWFIYMSLRFVLKKDLKSAKQLFLTSIVYLPLWFLVALLDMALSR